MNIKERFSSVVLAPNTAQPPLLSPLKFVDLKKKIMNFRKLGFVKRDKLVFIRLHPQYTNNSLYGSS